MSWLEKEVPSLELCKGLKELGYPQEGGGFYWRNNKVVFMDGVLPRIDTEKRFQRYYDKEKERGIEIVKAPTCRELGEWLPDIIDDGYQDRYFVEEKDESSIEIGYGGFGDIEYSVVIKITDPNEANARAKMLIWLKENGYVDFRKEPK